MSLLDHLTRNVWALHPPVFHKLATIVQRHAEGLKLDAATLSNIRAAREGSNVAPEPYTEDRGVAVIPVRGVIQRHASLVDEISGPSGTSTAQVSDALRAALADTSIRAILLHIDSPGGSVEGVNELAEEVRAARGKKPIVALADGYMASAALWVGVQAAKVYATSGSSIGSIGIAATVIDTHRAEESRGVHVQTITSAALKNATLTSNKVTSDELIAITEDIGAFHELFVDAVAEGRGMERDVAAALADGRVYVGAKAKAVGLIDEVASYEQVIATITGGATMAAKTKSGDPAKDAAVRITVENVPDTTAADPISDEESPDKEEPGEDESDDALDADPKSAMIARKAVEGERKRAAAIRSAALAGQEKLAAKLIDSGVPEKQAFAMLLADAKTRMAGTLNALRQQSAALTSDDELEGDDEIVSTSRGANASGTPIGDLPKPANDFEAQAQATWKRDPKVRAQFQGDYDAMLGSLAMKAAGVSGWRNSK